MCTEIGFKAVEWGAEIPDQYSVQELVAAREKAGVSVIGLCTPAGMFLFQHRPNCVYSHRLCKYEGAGGRGSEDAIVRRAE